jgi:UDP-glucose 4-epimerase
VSPPQARLTVAVTGPTGQIGQAVVDALERSREVARVIGMARRPFDPSARGWTKVSYHEGDVLDRGAVDDLVAGADVVVHLAFIIMGGAREASAVNREGSRNVFRATVAAGARRLVYASSVAAYGFHDENPQPLTEEVPARGSDAHYYSAQKAAVERLLRETLAGSDTDAYVLRPCIVGGPGALLLIENLPYVALASRLPAGIRGVLRAQQLLRPVIPDPGVHFQLVHRDDVASAIRSAVLGRGEPGVYNLAGRGELTAGDLARELGWWSVPVPRLAVEVTAETVSRVPFLPPQAHWIEVFRRPVIMDAAKARRELRWRPRYDSLATLRETIDAARERGLLA